MAHKIVLKRANSLSKYAVQIFPKNRIFLNSTIHPKLKTFHSPFFTLSWRITKLELISTQKLTFHYFNFFKHA